MAGSGYEHLGGSSGEASGKGACALKCLAGSCCTVALLLAGVYFLLVQELSKVGIEKMLGIGKKWVHQGCGSEVTVENMIENIWWPGCLYIEGNATKFDTGCLSPCLSTSAIKEAMEFNRANPGELVSYRSREHEGVESIELTGWWLPPVEPPAPAKGEEEDAKERLPEEKLAPRVVLQHGFSENSNMWRVVFAAYLLRKNGYGVLTNNFRDHCYSDDSENRVYEWGHAYPYDLLGAWDYAVKDPDGKLGGALSPGQVGIMGISKGAFTTVNAFGLEPNVPAVWVDGPPFTPKIEFGVGELKKLTSMHLGPLFPFVIDSVWSNVLQAAADKGVVLEKNLPEKVLPGGPATKRPIYAVGNVADTTVPIGELDKLVGLLEEYEDKYDVTSWRVEGDCKGDAHCTNFLSDSDEYSARMCRFWAGVFGEGAAKCAAA